MSLSEKNIKEFQEIYKKEYGKDLSDQEAYEAASRLAGLAEILLDFWVEEKQREKKLEDSPKGFHLEGIGYTCFICGNSVSNEQTWYDKYGIKCMTCQRAINRKEIPASLAKNKESWYSKYDLESSFNLKGPTLKHWIKSGILKVRAVTNDGKGIHTQLFLIKDNKDFLPPKNLVKSQSVKETIDGKDWIRIEPWYRFVDPCEHLKGYKIINYLNFTKEKVVDKNKEQ